MIKSLKELNVAYTNYEENDEEVLFNFKAADLEKVASLLKAKTAGARISPFSTKNLPVDRKLVCIPKAEIERYRKITATVDKRDLLVIHRITEQFLVEKLNKKYRKTDKSFAYKTDMRKLKLGRLTKEYIYYKGMWGDYLKYLEKGIREFDQKRVADG